jgi:hypothetical protein
MIAQTGTPQLQTGPAREAPTELLQQPGVISGKHLTKAQFESLPDNAVIDIRGTRTTAGELRAKLRQQEVQALARAQELAAETQAAFPAYRTKFLQDERARVKTNGAKAWAEFTRWRQAQATVPGAPEDAIAEEAIELMTRARTASPAEQIEIEQRARELEKRLQPRQVPR